MNFLPGYWNKNISGFTVSLEIILPVNGDYYNGEFNES